MTEELANKIYDVMVEVCGAAEGERFGFVLEFTKPEHTREWRFRGALGFGGKFWDANGRFYVTYYPEDETPEREGAKELANIRLGRIYRDAAVCS